MGNTASRASSNRTGTKGQKEVAFFPSEPPVLRGEGNSGANAAKNMGRYDILMFQSLFVAQKDKWCAGLPRLRTTFVWIPAK